MIIRKLFKFENAHIVRNCSTDKCKFSIHGHSYKVEVFVQAKGLDNGQMVMDFSILKKIFEPIIDIFDHSIAIWDGDDRDYQDMMMQHSKRWVLLPVSPSAEQLARVLFLLMGTELAKAELTNGEHDTLHLQSVRVHETDTGYAEAFADDIIDKSMGVLDVRQIVVSPAIKAALRKFE